MVSNNGGRYRPSNTESFTGTWHGGGFQHGPPLSQNRLWAATQDAPATWLPASGTTSLCSKRVALRHQGGLSRPIFAQAHPRGMSAPPQLLTLTIVSPPSPAPPGGGDLVGNTRVGTKPNRISISTGSREPGEASNVHLACGAVKLRSTSRYGPSLPSCSSRSPPSPGARNEVQMRLMFDDECSSASKVVKFSRGCTKAHHKIDTNCSTTATSEQPPEISLCLELKEKFLVVGCEFLWQLS